MILWLDHKIFGNGWGMKSPFHDDRFFWLVDTYKGDRAFENGELYKFAPGFGAQLTSFQWRRPKAGERRKLAEREFVAFHSNRRWFRVSVAWSWTRLPADIDQANAALRELERDLGRL